MKISPWFPGEVQIGPSNWPNVQLTQFRMICFAAGRIQKYEFLQILWLTIYGVDPFFSNLAVEEVPNHEFSLGHSHFAYVLPLSNHTSSTAKLEKKRIHPVDG